ncbi:FAD-dependent oxidoreductase [Nordella sp. HKS 07]|uniref:D-amino acid dehydrogenase n=1 Tax=Nordella sp. HKS 07 TaxID=2712222 RepID=UPI0013E10A35|nr:D-amino acid dehydrogenase [Nordella sp. HKS 07]QIG49988.1 FAD-dependent oxidoreductase [Nordella sp. HKS 07]
MTILVLGSGAVGVATAWYLNKAGQDVEVVERQPEAALETSWGNGGVIHASEVEPWSQPGMPRKIIGWLGKESAPLLLRYGAIPHMWRWGLDFSRNCTPEKFRTNAAANLNLALHSLKSLQEIASEAGITYDRATRGVLKIYRSIASLDSAQRSSDFLAQHGLLYERVDVERCVALEPALRETQATLAGALYFARDEVGDCHKFTQGLATACAKRGVRFRYGETVQSVETAGGHVVGVVTDKGRLSADTVVVAMGSFTSPLLAKLGIRIPIYPVKGISITFPRGAWNSAPQMPVIDDSKLFGLVPIGDRMRISGSAEISGYDTIPATSRAAAIVENASFTFPEMKRHLDLSKARVWAGLRPVSPAGTPIIGRTRVRGLWVNAGHGHLGWTLACGSGRVAADLITGRNPGIQVPAPQGAVIATAA